MASDLEYGLVLGALAGKRADGANDVSKGSTEWLEAKISVVDLPVPGHHATDLDI